MSLSLKSFLLSALLLFPALTYALEPLPYGINWHAYVNGSYNYLVRDHYFISGVNNRDNDFAENGARLQQGYFSLERDEEGVGGFTQIIAGYDAYTISPLGWDPNVFQLKNVGLAITQAYLQYKVADFTIQVGEEASLAGWEDYIYTKDSMFSRAIVYAYAEAGSHMGIRAIKQLNDNVGLTLGVFNGWNTIESAGRLNAVEAGFTFADNNSWQMNVNALMSPQYFTDLANTGPQGIRRFLEWYGSYQLTPQLQIVGIYDYGIQTRALLPTGGINQAVWFGLSLYLNYSISDDWFTSLRGEVFDDKDGYRTGVRQNWREATLSLDYRAIKNLHIIAETRHDFSNVTAFINKGSNPGLNQNQQSYALDLMYVFA